MPSSDGWSCPICLGRFERPVLVSCCGQSFCRSCLDDALRQADACPMCRSPLLSGPFSVTSNRALEDALSALSSSSPRCSTTEKQAATSFVDAPERKLATRTRDSEPEVQISVSSTVESDNSEAPLIHEEEVQDRRVQAGSRWRERLRLCRIRGVQCYRIRAASGRRCASTRSAELRQLLRQWQLWCRVNWASLQCVFYVVLFFVFVFFLRVQEEEFAENTTRLRRSN
ncbi:hypothetical protein L917_00097 [Phytophthora nicotianae]|uniref:RING-type domain-containing protein n=2 Tax=Phytophthora nicotianae TaxID=4792 RepID=W2HQ77_PHYNI|nr:hypothetical protein L915_00112 [Phytophthora nicotianae]ETM03724.1 hypothetical protein L917_00097 [Phytophthora nicotianae]ETO86336.1 hypothetical protein F444_00111 [Phytophthora nicotianae P1976]